MRGRASVVGVVAVAALGAGDGQRSVSVEDPCGDMMWVSTADGAAELQPEEWDRNDLAGLTVLEVRDDDGPTVGVDLVVETCGDAAPPDRPGEFLDVRWSLSNDCSASAAVGHGGNSVYVTGNAGVLVAPDEPRFSVLCRNGYAFDLVATVHEELGVTLDDTRVRRDGRSTVIELRSAELGDLGALVGPGATLPDAAATSYATRGTGVAVDGDGPRGAAGTTDWTPRVDAITLGG